MSSESQLSSLMESRALPSIRCTVFGLLLAMTGCATPSPPPSEAEESTVHVHYLEIVTPDVDPTCRALSELRGVEFGAPEVALGNARTAPLEGGGTIGVRAPLRETEEPVVRPYVLVDDIDAAVELARRAGGEIALPPTEIPGHGTIAIYFLGGIQHGLWQQPGSEAGD